MVCFYFFRNGNLFARNWRILWRDLQFVFLPYSQCIPPHGMFLRNMAETHKTFESQTGKSCLWCIFFKS